MLAQMRRNPLEWRVLVVRGLCLLFRLIWEISRSAKAMLMSSPSQRSRRGDFLERTRIELKGARAYALTGYMLVLLTM
jgi:hypothetical protein